MSSRATSIGSPLTGKVSTANSSPPCTSDRSVMGCLVAMCFTFLSGCLTRTSITDFGVCFQFPPGTHHDVPHTAHHTVLCLSRSHLLRRFDLPLCYAAIRSG